jgi:hypothetical protein
MICFCFLNVYSSRTLFYTYEYLRNFIYMCPTHCLPFKMGSSSVFQAKFLLCEQGTYSHLLLELLPKTDEISVERNASGASA